MRIIFLVLCCAFVMPAKSQNSFLSDWNAKRLKKQQTSMLILGGWSVGNMAFSAIALNTSNPETKAFHQMNIGWSAVNIGLATFGYFGARRQFGKQLSSGQSIKAALDVQRSFLLNAGIDVGYVMGGVYMLERSKTVQNGQQLAGFGRSVILQGTFLFVFDLFAYWWQTNDNKRFFNKMDGLELGLGSIYYKF